MHLRFLPLILAGLALVSTQPAAPIVIANFDANKIDVHRADGGLPHVPGVVNVEVYRAHEGDYTYNHHVDLARWKGKLYIGFEQCLKDEDTWPAREVLVSSSDNGQTWTPPIEMFPQGVSTALRTYFFIAPNGRMLVLAGLRMSHKKLTESKKGSLVVRALQADHQLGRVFALRIVGSAPANAPPLYSSATDPAFVDACRDLLADHVFLQQQDYGLLVDPADRIPWMDAKRWPGAAAGETPPGSYGKATCFFHRGPELVGISKRGWVTLSEDEGKSWSQPVIPATLVTGMGKVWCQKVEGGYAMAYNPHPKVRQPLVLASSSDGVDFNILGALQPEIPKRRFDGKSKDPGAQYIRGISEWADDHSFDDHHLYLTYSINKEDIFLAKVPLPLAEK